MQVVAKPRVAAANFDEEAEEDELAGIELSDEDDDDIIDDTVQILTEKSLRQLLDQMKARPESSHVSFMVILNVELPLIG